MLELVSQVINLALEFVLTIDLGFDERLKLYVWRYSDEKSVTRGGGGGKRKRGLRSEQEENELNVKVGWSVGRKRLIVGGSKKTDGCDDCLDEPHEPPAGF